MTNPALRANAKKANAARNAKLTDEQKHAIAVKAGRAAGKVHRRKARAKRLADKRQEA